MNKYLAAVLLTAGLLLPCVAQADVFIFDFHGTESSAHGYITATPDGGPTQTAIAGSGFYTGFAGAGGPALTNVAMTLVPGSGSDGSFIWDNVIYPGQPNELLGSPGLLFKTADDIELNIFGNGANAAYSGDTAPNNWFADAGSFTLTAVPEPSSIVFMGTLLLGVASALKRKLT